jgi:2-keto-3-deoxy-L-rhamnonate aldolase RhmA
MPQIKFPLTCLIIYSRKWCNIIQCIAKTVLMTLAIYASGLLCPAVNSAADEDQKLISLYRYEPSRVWGARDMINLELIKR